MPICTAETDADADAGSAAHASNAAAVAREAVRLQVLTVIVLPMRPELAVPATVLPAPPIRPGALRAKERVLPFHIWTESGDNWWQRPTCRTTSSFPRDIAYSESPPASRAPITVAVTLAA